MEASVHTPHHHEPMPSSGRALDRVAFSATLHCLTGCAIGEVLGMIIGTALGFSNWGTIALSVALAFLFGYSLTSLPLLRAGMALAAVVPIALATDTFSIAVMEIVDNGLMLAIPGAMHAGVGDVLFWGALSFALVIAGLVAFPVNRWLITRGKGHAVLHETGIHGGPPTRVVATIAAVAFVFGSTVLAAEAISGDDEEHGAVHAGTASGQEAVRGLAVSSDGLTLQLDDTGLEAGREEQLRFRVVDENGRPVRNFEVEHEKRMHFIVARRDLSSFQHLHPKLERDGTWTTPLTLREAGNYRVFADFKRDGRNQTLGADVAVDGKVDWQQLPAASDTATTAGGYEVKLHGAGSRAGRESELRFTVTRNGRPVQVERYLGAGGHLVALREGDLAYLHVHPTEAPASGDDGHGDADQHGSGDESRGAAQAEGVAFATEFPTAGRYRLFLQFKHDGRVRTAAFTQEVSR